MNSWGDGSVDRTVASDSRDPQFDYHQLLLTNSTNSILERIKLFKKRPGLAYLFLGTFKGIIISVQIVFNVLFNDVGNVAKKLDNNSHLQ